MPSTAPWGGDPNRARVRRADKIPPPPDRPKTGCCPMVAATRAARRGKFRLARRYAGWSVRLLLRDVRFASSGGFTAGMVWDNGR